MKVKELTEKDDKYLLKLLAETKAKVVKDRFKIASKEMTTVSEIKKTKKTIAQIETILRERVIITEEKLKNQEDKKTGAKK